MSLMDFVVSPRCCGWSVTDFWGWDAHEAQLRCPDEVDGNIWIWSTRRGLKPKLYYLPRPWSPWGSPLLAMCWMARWSNSSGGKIFHTCPDWPWGPPSLLVKPLNYQISWQPSDAVTHATPPPHTHTHTHTNTHTYTQSGKVKQTHKLFISTFSLQMHQK
jgi:hypothetical protein